MLKVLAFLAALGAVDCQRFISENVLSPPYFNIATGKKIEATSTCGEDGDDVFCKLTGGPNEYGFDENINQGQFCDVCSDVNDYQRHDITNAIDGTEKWWQSPPLSKGNKYNEVNVTIHLGQIFHVAYILIKFANSPRAGTWVLERSSDHGKTFQPWQYFANSDSDCHNRFGIDAFETINRDDTVLCTADYSDVVPLENGEVIVSLINRRPGARNFSHSPVLQEWSKATDIRLRLLRTKTLLGHLMAVERQDPTVTRRYFYSIKDISIGGRCVCNGHADICEPDHFDQYKLKCQCRHNTCGDSCEMCCPSFVQKAWRPAVPESTNECEACNCHGHSFTCHFSEDVARRRLSLDLSGNYEGGGVCENCRHHTTGINCEQCEDGFYRPANVDPTDPNGCRPMPYWYTYYRPYLDGGFDLISPPPFVTAGPLHTTQASTASHRFPILLPPTDDPYPEFDLDRGNELGSASGDDGLIYVRPNWPKVSPDFDIAGSHSGESMACECDSSFTVGTCEPVTGRCYCKPKYAGDRCDRCAPGYYEFPECKPCPCYYNATRDEVCLPQDGICPCKYNFAGTYCDECAPGFYNFPECTPCQCYNGSVTSFECDQYTGKCPCQNGFGGKYCDQCADGYFNYPLCQICECTSFTTDEVCDKGTGECFCSEHVTGTSCNECEGGRYDFPHCKECDCTSPGSANNLCDRTSGKCECKPNFAGDQCEKCAPEYFDYPNCIPCNCNIQGSKRTTCDAVSGQCSCNSYISGRQCDQCAPDYFNFPVCEDCKCNPYGIKEIVPGVCLAFSAGQCDCKDNVMGVYCDVCKPLHYNVTQGCLSCNCFLQGTLDGVAACDTEGGDCWCKAYTTTQRCSQCDDAFYNLREANYLGCDGCDCDVGGSMSYICDTNTGQCQCRTGVEGRPCDKVIAGYYFPTLLQHQFEVEDGRTDGNNVLRYLADETQFPDYSMRGYAVFSGVQRRVTVPITIEYNSLYQLVFLYNSDGMLRKSNITFQPVRSYTGSAQSFKIQFAPASTPTIHKVPQTLVLNQGKWNVVIEAEEGLMIDYFALLPSEYYEPGKLQLSITEPCVPQLTPSEDLCLMYSHIDISQYPSSVLTHNTDKIRHGTPTTAHPQMVILDGNSIGDNEEKVSTSVQLDAPGKYVIVLEYASTQGNMQTISATVTDSTGRVFNDVKFNAYTCGYSFICRQVALTPLSDVMVFDVSVSDIQVDLKVDAGENVYVRSIHLIPYEEWTMEQVEPKVRCITKKGPEFAECVGSSYPIPYPEYKFDVDGNEGVIVPTATNQEVSAKFLGKGDTVIQIPVNLDPGRYVFLLHYYNPASLSFSPEVLVDSGVDHHGTANVTYCPHGDGCRAVFTTDGGKVVLDITNPQTIITITVPEDNQFYLDYVIAIPEAVYNPSMLKLNPVDLSRRFYEQCFGRGFEGLQRMGKEDNEFCRDSIFTLTTDYNNGALPCMCDGAGTVGGENAVCRDFGGQCPCKENVIGRQCTICKHGYYGFPDCKPCDCGGAWCDQTSGDCICPPNTIKPDCNECIPFTHSFHPLAGCVGCDCNAEGVEDAADLGCNKVDGQCRCRENVEGHKCDKCKPGFYGFPACNKCICQESGRISEGCDADTGNCICKENVEGQQCDRCKPGNFYLDEANPLGCTSCFCFNVAKQCHSTQFPMKTISNMEGWRILNLASNTPEIERSVDGKTSTVNLEANGGPSDITNPHIYWAAPKDYLFDQVGSYGGSLKYITTSIYGGRGDSGRGGPSGASPAPLTAPVADVILHGGDGMVVGWVNRDGSGDGQLVNLRLTESNFVHQTTKQPVKREEMMRILSDLSSLRIRATSDPTVNSVALSSVEMDATDYDKPRNSGPTIPTVEECICPKGYIGQSCQLCDKGYYRDRNLGACLPCKCNGNCEVCGESGELLDEEDCLYNTAGKECQVCADGFIGNATNGDPNACKPCPCPIATEGRNFAERCEMPYEDELICHCKPGYTGATCEQCASGYFGNPMSINGECRKCNCHGNQDANMIMETCDPLTGECSDCAYSTGGKYCEKCADGFFGDALVAKNCTACSCFGCGTEICDHRQGHCACKPHVLGDLCDRCEPGFFNIDSCVGCLNCDCKVGATSSVCNEYTGRCECAPNVVGDKCDKCAPGHWDYSAAGCRPCNCRNNGPCNPENGACQCPPGITGIQCDQCKLPRHILLPGELKCEGCDTCVHDLLDTVEPLTTVVLQTQDDMSTISVGVAAQKRLDRLQDELDTIQANMTAVAMDDVAGEAERFFGGDEFDIGPLPDISGSGNEELPPAPLLESSSDDDTYEKLQAKLVSTEGDVSVMCNHTNQLLDTVTTTSIRANEAKDNANSLNNSVGSFANEARELITKLEEESSGDDEDYKQMIMDAEMLINRMKERDFTNEKKIAEEELALAQKLFDMVGGNFTIPAGELETNVTTVSDDLATKKDKMNELRTLLNDATKKVTDVSTMNDANSKALSSVRDLINEINSEWDKIQQTLDDAAAAIEGGLPDPEILETTILNEEVARLQPVVTDLLNGLKRIEGLFNQSIAKADMLANDADILVRIVEETNSEPRVVRAVDAANRYRNIINAINAAKEAADQAKLDATEAHMNVQDRNLGEAADAAEDRGSKLLSEAQDISNNRMNDLQSDLDDAKSSIDAILLTVDNSKKRLDNIDDTLNNLNYGNVLEKSDQAKAVASDAEAVADAAIATADELQKAVDSAPDPNVPIEDELDRVQEALAVIPDEVAELTDTIADLKDSAERISAIPTQLKMDDKVKEIRKRIELARALAGTVKAAMTFKKLASPEFAQVRIPPQLQGLDEQLKIEIYVNVSDEPNNSILYFGDASSPNGDYMLLETVGGNVRYKYKVGGGVGTLETEGKINDNEWHRIEIERFTNIGVLRVDFKAEESRGDDNDPDATFTEEKEGVTDSEDVKSNLPPESTVFFIGGVPLITMPDGATNQKMSGTMQEVAINDNVVGIWNFHDYVGPKPAPGVAARKGAGKKVNSFWKFRGGDSYIRVGEEYLSLGTLEKGDKPFVVQFKIFTLQRDSLLFFIGQTTNQFFALELRDGKFVITCNFDFPGGIHSQTLTNYQDVTTFPTPILVKAGVLPKLKMIVLSLNSQLNLRMKYDSWSPNITGDAWLGGIYHNDIKDEFRPIVQNIDVHYRGCVSTIALITKNNFDPYKAKERIGVQRGCTRDTIGEISFDGASYVAVASDLSNVAEYDGSLSASTLEPNGEILTTTNTDIEEEDSEIELLETEIIAPTDYEEEIARSILGEDLSENPVIEPVTEDVNEDPIMEDPIHSDILEISNIKEDKVLESEKLDLTNRGTIPKNEEMEFVNPKDSTILKEVKIPKQMSENIEFASTTKSMIEPEFVLVEDDFSLEVNGKDAVFDEEVKSVRVEFDVTEEMVTTKPPQEKKSTRAPVAPTIEMEENAIIGKNPNEAFEEDLSAYNLGPLPAVLIVIAVVVAVSLIAAIISVVMKSSLVGGSSAPGPHPPTPEQQYLNDVQPPRVAAQMQW